MRRRGLLWLLLGMSMMVPAHPESLSADRLGVLYNLDDAASREVAQFYATQRGIPAARIVGVHLPQGDVISPAAFEAIRSRALDQLPANVQSLALLWTRPYAVGCMSITTAFAAGYHPGFCEPGCARTLPNPLFDSRGWLPADTVGWWPAMLLPTDDVALAKALIRRGMAAGGPGPAGIAYLVRTQDAARNVRAAGYPDAQQLLSRRLPIRQLTTPVAGPILDAIAYFTGAVRVEELPRIHFRPGAVADHLTSSGGVLTGGSQMSALAWIGQGATASYGTVTEPCNIPGKFPSPAVFLDHYTRGETVLESYWKSVAMPGQGLFIGEPLARAFPVESAAARPR